MPAVVRLAALLGIGLTAAALVLPSGDAPVMVPADTLQPAAGLPTAPAGAEAPVERPFAGVDGAAQTTPTEPASSSASVAGAEVEAGVRDRAARRSRTKAKARSQPSSPASGRPRPPQPERRPPASTRPAQPSQTPPRAAVPVAPAPAATKPRPSQRRGGPAAEFGL
ncbi:MAG: hypothetical protein JHD16_17960 [Solirubrobacteraceae bacterium]|nr:hypothetical protein [Solirubrobacteraceae bacterium]